MLDICYQQNTDTGFRMNIVTLKRENRAFRGTRGVSRNNRSSGFRPAFLDKKSGRVEVARLSDGKPAPVHVISWLPKEWATSVDTDGAVLGLKPGVISGFVKDGVFYTRQEVAEL